jgi:hypothetical protein
MWLDTEVSEHPTGPIFKSPTVQEDSLTLEAGTGRLFRNVGNCQSTLRTKKKGGFLDLPK